MTLRVRFQVRALHKDGNSPHEYEDASYPRQARDTDAWYFRAALADGASETSFAREWAQELVTGFGRGRLKDENYVRTLPLAQARWRHRLGSVQSLPWYAQAKLEAGAFCAFLGLTIREETDPRAHGGSWKAMAAGDTCLFHLRGGRRRQVFPLDRAEDFSIRPRLLGSIAKANGQLASLILRSRGSWQTGDRFVLATDAIACWLLTPAGTTDQACLMSSMQSEVQFVEFVTSLRSAGALRNDDVTVAVIDIEA